MKSKPRLNNDQIQATLTQINQAMTNSVTAATHASAVTTSGCTCCGGGK